MLSSDFKKGATFSMDGQIYTVVDFSHHQQPRLAPFIRATLKNVMTGAVQERRFTTNDKLDDVELTNRNMQFLYNEENIYTFMDTETYEQFQYDYKDVKDAIQYNAENVIFKFNFANNMLVEVIPPTFVDLKVVKCDLATAGDTVKNALKPATLESGLEIRVPMFISEGEIVRVDTRDGSYSSRVTKI